MNILTTTPNFWTIYIIVIMVLPICERVQASIQLTNCVFYLFKNFKHYLCCLLCILFNNFLKFPQIINFIYIFLILPIHCKFLICWLSTYGKKTCFAFKSPSIQYSPKMFNYFVIHRGIQLLGQYGQHIKWQK